jgi:hypothetical protein
MLAYSSLNGSSFSAPGLYYYFIIITESYNIGVKSVNLGSTCVAPIPATSATQCGIVEIRAEIQPSPN